MWACEVDPREAGRCRECTTTRGSARKSPIPVGARRPSISTGEPRTAGRPQIASWGRPRGPAGAGPVDAVTRRSALPATVALACSRWRPRSTAPRHAAARGQASGPGRSAGTPIVVRGFEPPPEPWLAGHRGVDLLASPGDAGARGRRRTGDLRRAGSAGCRSVTVTHPDGRRTTYEPVLAAVVRGDAGGARRDPRPGVRWRQPLPAARLPALGTASRGAATSIRCRWWAPTSEVRLLPLWSERSPRRHSRRHVAPDGSARRAGSSSDRSCRLEVGPVQGSRASVARTSSSRVCLDDERHAGSVLERPAQDDESRVDERVHEGRVLRPAGLFFQRLRRGPTAGRSAAVHHEKRCHPRAF